MFALPSYFSLDKLAIVYFKFRLSSPFLFVVHETRVSHCSYNTNVHRDEG